MELSNYVSLETEVDCIYTDFSMEGALGFPGLSMYWKELHSRGEHQNIRNHTLEEFPVIAQGLISKFVWVAACRHRFKHHCLMGRVYCRLIETSISPHSTSSFLIIRLTQMDNTNTFFRSSLHNSRIAKKPFNHTTEEAERSRRLSVSALL